MRIQSATDVMTVTTLERCVFPFICFGLLLSEHFANLGKGTAELGKVYIFWKATPYDLAAAVILVWCALNWENIRQYLLRREVVLAFLLFVFSIVVGMVRNGFRDSWLLYDIRIVGSLFLGVVLGVMLLRSRIPLIFVALFLFCTIGLLIRREQIAGQLTTNVARIVDPSIFIYWGLALVPCGIVGAAAGRYRYLARGLFAISCAALLHSGLVVTATRSCIIASVILAALTLLVWMQTWRYRWLNILALALFVGAIALIILTDGGSVLETTRSSTRLAVDRIRGTKESHANIDARVIEVEQLFHELSSLDYAMGRGMGGAIVDVNNTLDTTPSLHISIFNVLLKWGLLPFLLIVWLLLIRMPLRFIYAIWRHRGNSDPAGQSTLMHYPAVATITSLMCMSGGFGEGIFLWLGVLYAFHIDMSFGLRNERTGGTRTAWAIGGPHRAGAPLRAVPSTSWRPQIR